MKNNYYVYAYLDPKTSEIKYIGKGKGDRLNTHWKRKDMHWNALFKEFLFSIEEPKIVKLAEGLSNSEAYIKEYHFIKKYGRVGLDEGGILFNRSSGFEGVNIPDDMWLADYLDSRPHFNFKELNEEEITEIVKMYSTGMGLVAIAKQLNTGPGKIKSVIEQAGITLKTKGGQIGSANGMYGVKRLNNAHFTGKSHSIESKQKISNSLKNINRGRSITINSVQYNSISEAHKKTGIPASTISRNVGKTIIRRGVKFTILQL
jgi:hypothetical protein